MKIPLNGVIKIGDKKYLKVSARLQMFRSSYSAEKNWKIINEIVNISDTGVIFKSSIVNPDDKVVSIGHGYNDKVNDKSMEKAETCAVGRALAFFDHQFGGDYEIASADEIEKMDDMTTGTSTELERELNQIQDQLKTKNANGVFVMPGGKHKGVKITEVPTDYMVWCLQNNKFNDDVKPKALAEMKRRNDAKDPEHQIPDEFDDGLPF
tara:strand:- start:2661 stop:3287 length:627 start_codon:yes stop_codon:yes gene_type:complete